MKITMFELLGMVKDGKMPKKIKYRQNIFEFIHGLCDYKPDDIKKYHGNYLFHYLFEEEINFLNDEVEILDYDEEKGLPEKLETYKENNEIFLENFCYKNLPIHKDSLNINERVLVDKLNEIIDYLKKQRKGE